MKITGTILIIIGILGIIGMIIIGLVSSNEFDNDFNKHWDLCCKSLNIREKSNQIDSLIFKLENRELQGEYNSFRKKISNQGFDENLKSMKTYQSILHRVLKTPGPAEIGIDTTLAYEGILGYLDRVERDQIQDSYDVIGSIWYKVHWIYMWGWISITLVLSLIATVIVGIIMCND